MSGYCPDCGNTGCECDEITKATYPFRMAILELEKEREEMKTALFSLFNEHYADHSCKDDSDWEALEKRARLILKLSEE
jgi:hypothetical protein